MAYRWHPKNAEVDGESPRAWSTCDRCGFIYNLHKLQWQYSYMGAFQAINTRLLVCSSCLDPLNPSDQAYILPPDPAPIFNARPEPYTIDETSWLTTQAGDVIATQDGNSLISPIPSPDSTQSVADQASVNLTTEAGAEIVTEAGDGNPLDFEPNP